MRLYIWEGHGISTGYHDDGTLVVLAGSVEEAREAAIASAPRRGPTKARERDRWQDGNSPGYPTRKERTPRLALAAEPDRVIPIGGAYYGPARVIVFNGGGYD